jgi:hypothetical protein
MGISTFGKRAGPLILPGQEPLREIESLLHLVKLLAQLLDLASQILQLAISTIALPADTFADGAAQRPAQNKNRRKRHEQNDYGEFRTVKHGASSLGSTYGLVPGLQHLPQIPARV